MANNYALAKKFNVTNSFGIWIDDAYLTDSIRESSRISGHEALRNVVNWRIKGVTSNTCGNETGDWIDTDYAPCQLVSKFRGSTLPQRYIFSR